MDKLIPPDLEFILYLRFKRGYLACTQVNLFSSIADVIALDKNKKFVLEFEFKKTSHDLKVLEKKKIKHDSPYRQPHKFYYVVPTKLWKKEEAYLREQKCGVVVYSIPPNSPHGKREFITEINCQPNKSIPVDYDFVYRQLMIRCTSAYANMIMDCYGRKRSWY